MVNDLEIQKAVAAIQLRSERQRDLHKLVGSFVDIGILQQLQTRNHQIVYGRRGTGKTHILGVLAADFANRTDATVCSIDARTLGSSSQFSDHTIPMSRRCLSIFRDILAAVHDELLATIVNRPTERASAALDELDELAGAVTDPVTESRIQEATFKDTKAVEDSGQLNAGVNPTGSSVSGMLARNRAETLESARRETFTHEDKVVFPAINRILAGICEKACTNLYLLIDEWSSLPTDLQPYLAEFIKRGFLPNPAVVVKIAALEYKSAFGIQVGPRRAVLGFEVGADIATGLDLDDYYVFDRNPDQVTMAFAEMLYKHLQSELPEDYLRNVYLIETADQLVKSLFTNSTTSFQELVRASEGVARDLINTFVQAFFATQRKGTEKIEKKTITEAAHQWFEQEKAKNLDEELSDALQRICRNVIGERKVRSFLVTRELERDDLIQRLFDARVLHLVRRGYADKDNPGVRYNIFTLDYGTYVDLLGTSRAPQEISENQSDGAAGEFVVPFDDKRRIRRVILTKQVLYPPQQTTFPAFEGNELA